MEATIQEFDKKQRRKEYMKEYMKVYMKDYYQANKEYIKDYMKVYLKDYYRANKSTLNKQKRVYLKNKYHTNPEFRLNAIIRSQVKCALNGRTKDATTFTLLGYTRQTFNEYFKHQVEHFESKGITTHLDHKIPQEWFKPGTPISVMFDLRNLQIIPAADNQDKKHYYPSIADMSYMKEVRQHIKEEYLCW